ncbi:hypothetical protein [Nocardioides alcanivorans]|uniref:hypothetical protein n=1 Tax=Nocardioides alcanivorans TaxID=2897352 RepID=UPI001F35D992|nr:hypothetical protein [Nocardioides alcanivorans]
MIPSRRSRLRAALPAALVVVLVALTACSSGDDDVEKSSDTLEGMSGVEIRDAAKAAMSELEAVHVVASLPQGERAIELDVRVDAEGNCQASVDMGPGRAVLVADGTATWVKGDRDFWVTATTSEDLADRVVGEVGDGWARLSDDEFSDQLTGICNLDELIGSINEGDKADIDVQGVVDHEGAEAQELMTTSESGEISNVLIAFEAPHRVLQVRRDAPEATAIHFDEFDEAVTVQVPDDDETVALAW